MSELLARIVDGTLIWLAVLVISSLCCALLYPAFRSRYRLTPDVAATFQLAWGLLPLLAATGVTLLVLNPALSAALIPEHCHDGNCLPHAPGSGLGTTTVLIVVAAISLVALFCIILMARALNRIQRWLRTLHLLSRMAHDQPYRIIDTDQPLAWCVGFWRPQVYLSRGLLTRLTSEQVQVVLAHERGHSLRQDNLRRLLLKVSSLAWPRSQRRQLLGDFGTSTEQACDQFAVSSAETRQLVIATIKTLDQRSHSIGRNPLRTPSGADTQRRLEWLQGPEREMSSPLRALAILSLLWIGQIALLTGIAHRGYEWLF